MPRLSRLSVTGQAHHVIQRGNNREPIFFEEGDYETFLALLEEYAGAFICDIHAYVLMTNHIHLLATPRRENGLSLLMQFVGRRYVRYINKKYERTGTLWEGRFRSSVIESDQYLLTCMRYIELNPMRARMVRKPENYRWSSYHRNSLGDAAQLISSHGLYAGLGATAAKRQAAYRALFDEAITQDDLDSLRSAVHGGWAVGSDRFKNKIARASGQRTTPVPRGGDRRSERFRDG